MPLITKLKSFTEAQEFKTLNDVNLPGFEKGPVEIWFLKRVKTPSDRETLGAFQMGYKFLVNNSPELIKGVLENPEQTHVLVGKIAEKDLETIYFNMQGENWSPEGEARSLIQKLGVGRTSMSMGDLVKNASGLYLVDSVGFRKLDTL